MNEGSGIDPSVLRFLLALAIVAVLVEIVSQFSNSAAWILYIVIVLGLLLNNPVAIGLISLGGDTLREGVS